MKPKTLLILLVLLALLAGAGALLIHSRGIGSGKETMGALLFEGLPVNEIASIVIQTPTETATLKRGPDLWTVQERFDYPADFSKISDFVRALRGLKTGRRFESTEEVKARLALRSSEEGAEAKEKGTRIRMADAKGKILADLVLGNTRNRDPQKGPPDGQYLMLTGTREVCLVDKILSSYQVGPAQWLEKSPVRVEAADIRKIACIGPDSGVIYALQRPQKGKDLEWVGPKPDREISKGAVNRLSGALASLRIDDVAPVSADSGAFREGGVTRLDYTLFDGRIYHVDVGKSCSATSPCRIRLGLDWDKGAAQGEGADKGPEAEGKEKGTLSPEDVAALKERLEAWVFTLPEWQHQAFFTNVDQLLEPKKEGKGPSAAPGK